jgi:hypothetical protein
LSLWDNKRALVQFRFLRRSNGPNKKASQGTGFKSRAIKLSTIYFLMDALGASDTLRVDCRRAIITGARRLLIVPLAGFQLRYAFLFPAERSYRECGPTKLGAGRAYVLQTAIKGIQECGRLAQYSS